MEGGHLLILWGRKGELIFMVMLEMKESGRLTSLVERVGFLTTFKEKKDGCQIIFKVAKDGFLNGRRILLGRQVSEGGLQRCLKWIIKRARLVEYSQIQL